MAGSPGGIEIARLSARVVPDTSRLFAEIDAELKKIEARTSLNINASIDTARLDFEARAAVDQAQLAAGDLNIKARVDTSQLSELDTVLSSSLSNAGGLSSGLGGIGSAAVLLGPALIPLVAVLGGLAAALVAPLAIAGGGLTLFGLFAGFAVKGTLKQIKQISDFKTKLAGLTKGTAEYAQVSSQLRVAQQALTPAQTAFSGALDRVKGAFQSIPKSIILKPITDGLNLLARVLPLLTPVIKAVSSVLDGLMRQLDRSARSQGFKDFVDAFAKRVGPDLKAFARIGTNVFKGFFGLFGAFGKSLSKGVLKGLEDLTGRFATFGQTVGQSKGFKAFVDYVKKVGPQVGRTLGDVAGAIVAIATAMAPIGGLVLSGIDKLARAVQAIPLPVLAALGVSISLIAGVGVGPGIGLLVGGFVLLIQKSKPLRDIVGQLGDYFKQKLLPPIKAAAHDVIPALRSALHNTNQALRDNKPLLKLLGEGMLTITSKQVVAGLKVLAFNFRAMGLAIRGGVGYFHVMIDVVLLLVRVATKGFALLVKVVLASFGTLLDAAAKAFGWIPGIGPKITKAAAGFHTFADGVNASLQTAQAGLKRLQERVDGVHGPKPFKITVQDLNAVKSLEALQAFRLKDKTLTVNMVERIVGPGGGIGQPGKNSAGFSAPRSVQPPSLSGSAGQGGSSGKAVSPVTINTAYLSDQNAVLRHAQKASRARGGGWVNLPPAKTVGAFS